MKLLRQLNERAPQTVIKAADTLVGLITSALPVEEMRANRGQNYATTNYYQIRIKPKDKNAQTLAEIQDALEKFLKSPKMKSLGVKDVVVNQRSVNSSKYSSVSFTYAGIDYDVVIALGSNKGETFEKELLLKMDHYLAVATGVSEPKDEAAIEQARAAFEALHEADPEITIENVQSVSPRSGTTQRSGDLTPEETGAIIADIVIHLKNGKKKYVSLKNADGSTVAQFGLAKAFNQDLSVNTDSTEWKTWLAPFGLDPKRITEGLRAARDQTDLPWNDIVHTNIKVQQSSPIFHIMQKLWGANYIYLREKRGGFYAIKIDRDYVDNVLLGNLQVTEIRYPSKDRKQISIYLQSRTNKFKLEVRNPRGRGEVRPTQIQLIVMKGNK